MVRADPRARAMSLRRGIMRCERMSQMKKQMMFAAPIVAAMTFVCQPAFGADTPGSTTVDRAANDAGRAIDQAGNEVNRAADRAGTSVDAAARDASDAAQVAGSRVDASSMR